MQQLLDKSSNFISEAAKILGQTASHVYQVLVRQSLVEGIGSIVQILILGIFIFIYSILFSNFIKKNWKNYSDDGQFACVLGGVMLTIIIISGVFWASGEIALAIQKIINPEYFAIKFIFDSVASR